MLLLSILISVSPAKAAFASLVIPGAGDLMLGEKKRASFFISIEAATWLSYFGFKWYEGKTHNSSLNYAKLYAGANVDGKDSRYFNALEDYFSSDEYNEIIKEEARYLYPDTTDPDEIEKRKDYIENYSYTGDDAWEWSSGETSDKYDELRDRKRGFANKATNMIGIAVANRVVNFFVTYIAGRRVSVLIKNDGVQLGVKF